MWICQLGITFRSYLTDLWCRQTATADRRLFSREEQPTVSQNWDTVSPYDSLEHTLIIYNSKTRRYPVSFPLLCMRSDGADAVNSVCDPSDVREYKTLLRWISLFFPQRGQRGAQAVWSAALWKSSVSGGEMEKRSHTQNVFEDIQYYFCSEGKIISIWPLLLTVMIPLLRFIFISFGLLLLQCSGAASAWAMPSVIGLQTVDDFLQET